MTLSIYLFLFHGGNWIPQYGRHELCRESTAWGKILDSTWPIRIKLSHVKKVYNKSLMIKWKRNVAKFKHRLKKSDWKHQQPPNFNGLDWVRERRRERGEQREGCETAEKGERRGGRGVWSGLGGGGVAGVTSSVTSAGRQHPCCREHLPTSSLLSSVSRPHPYALEQCQLSLKLLLVLFLPPSCSISKLCSAKTTFAFPHISRLHGSQIGRFQSTFCLHCNQPNLVPSGGFKGEACNFSNVKIHSLMCKCKTSVGLPKSVWETRHIIFTLN